MAELQLATAFRSRKRFALSKFFTGAADDVTLNVVNVKTRLPLQRENGKNMETDVRAESSRGRLIVVEVRKRKTKTNLTEVQDFIEKVDVLSQNEPDKIFLPAFLSLGGFTVDAEQYCRQKNVAVAENVKVF